MKSYHILFLSAAALLACIFPSLQAQEVSQRPDSSFHSHHGRPHDVQPLLNPDSTEIYRLSGDTVFVNSVRLGRDIKGYRDVTPVEVAVVRGKVESVRLLNNHESRGYIRKVSAAGLFDAWNGLSVAEAAELKVDAVSGATFSSTAILENVRLALNYCETQKLAALAGDDDGPSFGPILWTLCAAVLLLLLFFIVTRKKRA